MGLSGATSDGDAGGDGFVSRDPSRDSRDPQLLELRRFQDADEPAVWELHRLGLAGTHADLGNGPWDDDLRSIPDSYLATGGEFLVGVVSGRVVAMGALRRITDSVAELKRMRVHPRFQRRGFGRLILASLEHRARELGYAKLTLDTGVVLTAARRLYESAGYREAGRGRIGAVEVIYFEKRLA
jgi:GNAT superfamily N-acetyltransferase